MSILKELPELVSNKIITPDIARDIQEYYAKKGPQQSNLLTIFGSLGAILVGLGIILIFAHNWDNFSRITQTCIAIVPLFAFQALAGYVLLKNKSAVWREVSGILLYFYVGASIALVSQIYNIPGSIGTFLATWVMLCLPLLYLLRSNTIFILLLVFSTYYACDAGYFNTHTPYLYLLFIAALLPYYIQQIKESGHTNFVSVLHFLIPLSGVITLGTFIRGADLFGIVIHLSFACILYSIGRLAYFKAQKSRNGYTIIGTAGIVVILLLASSHKIWEDINLPLPPVYFIVVWGVFLVAGIYLAYLTKRGKYAIDPFSAVLFIFPFIYAAAMHNAILPAVISNIMVLLLGTFAIKKGIARVDFQILNLGLSIIAILVIFRFFDTNMSFVLRGILFIAVGVGFFLANYLLIKKKKDTTTNTL